MSHGSFSGTPRADWCEDENAPGRKMQLLADCYFVSNAIFWAGPLRTRGAPGTLAHARVPEITSAIVREYFDQTMMGRPSPILGGTVRFPEVSVRAVFGP